MLPVKKIKLDLENKKRLLLKPETSVGWIVSVLSAKSQVLPVTDYPVGIICLFGGSR